MFPNLHMANFDECQFERSAPVSRASLFSGWSLLKFWHSMIHVSFPERSVKTAEGSFKKTVCNVALSKKTLIFVSWSL